MSQDAKIILPTSVISPIDIARMLHETEALDEFFRQTTIKGQEVQIPRYSRLLDEVVSVNKLNLLDANTRTALIAILKDLHENAPVLHISFSADPPGSYIQQIVAWLRQNVHHSVLVRVGLQPNIGAGCIVRSTNKTFDFSLRNYFDSKKDFFAKKLHDAVRPDVENFNVEESQTVTGVTRKPETTEADNKVVDEKPKVAVSVAEQAIAPAPETQSAPVKQAPVQPAVEAPADNVKPAPQPVPVATTPVPAPETEAQS